MDRSLALARGALRESIVVSARSLGLLLLSVMIVGWPQAAFAYRPFDSTDPAVADPGEVEIELSPVSFRRDDSGETWIAPQLRLNYGFARNWELVVEGQGEHPQAQGAPSVLVENAVFLKHVVREGTLQEQLGPSIAIEVGTLLPGINDQSGFGAELAGIVGGRTSWGAIHFTAAATLTRDNRGEMFLGTIIEGPSDWAVRPVAEIVYEREFGASEVFAALAGVIWEAREGLAFDLAVRQAAVDGEPETEVRVGLTFAFSPF
jgi:hypothetical protein